MTPNILSLESVGSGDLAVVGGKNASLGEMYQELQAEGVPVPNGFALTTHAYRELVDSGLPREALNAALEDVDVMDVTSLGHGRIVNGRAGPLGRAGRGRGMGRVRSLPAVTGTITYAEPQGQCAW